MLLGAKGHGKVLGSTQTRESKEAAGFQKKIQQKKHVKNLFSAKKVGENTIKIVCQI